MDDVMQNDDLDTAEDEEFDPSKMDDEEDVDALADDDEVSE